MRRALLVLALLLAAVSPWPSRLSRDPKVAPRPTPSAATRRACGERSMGWPGGVDQWALPQDDPIFIRIPGPDGAPINFTAVIICP